MVSTLHPVIREKNEQQHRLVLVTGGVLEMWSLDEPDAARGRAYARIVIDEAASVRKLLYAWQQDAGSARRFPPLTRRTAAVGAAGGRGRSRVPRAPTGWAAARGAEGDQADTARDLAVVDQWTKSVCSLPGTCSWKPRSALKTESEDEGTDPIRALAARIFRGPPNKD